MITTQPQRQGKSERRPTAHAPRQSVEVPGDEADVRAKRGGSAPSTGFPSSSSEVGRICKYSIDTQPAGEYLTLRPSLSVKVRMPDPGRWYEPVCSTTSPLARVMRKSIAAVWHERHTQHGTGSPHGQ